MSVKAACRAAGMARSALYYAGRHGRDKEMRDRETLALIEGLGELERRLGAPVNHKRVARVCRKYGILSGIRRPKFPAGYYRKLEAQRERQNGNVLGRDFRARRPGQKFATDISCFKVREGFLYLSAIKDLHSGEIVASLCSRSCGARLAAETLRQLRGARHCLNALMHSDLGNPYVSRAFLEECEIGYYGILKSKLLTYEEMERAISDYIWFYNNRRLQKKLGWMTPVEYREIAA